MEIIIVFVRETVKLWLEMSPYLLVGIIFAGLLHIFLGKEFITNQLGKPGIKSVVKASLLGIPLPVCSCGVIPLASSLRKDGAHKSSVLSFLVSTPTTGVDAIFATYSLLGPLFAIFRPLQALVSGITLGTMDYLFEGKNEKILNVPKHPHINVPFRGKVRVFLKYSFSEIPEDIGKWLILGTVIGGAITAFIPEQLFTAYVRFPYDFIFALVLGVPIYVCATGSIPITASLIAKGFSPGAGLVFLIVGPATNVITLSFVRAKLGRKSFYMYISNIVVTSVLFGLLFNYIWSFAGGNIKMITGGGEMLPLWLKITSASVLILLITKALFTQTVSIDDPDLEITVPDIDCSKCKTTLESKLNEVDGIEAVSVDITNKLVKIRGTVQREKALETIKKTGYHPKT